MRATTIAINFLLVNDIVNLKNISFLFTAFGILSLLFALSFLLIIKYSLYKGLGVSFLIFGISQGVIGYLSSKAFQKSQETTYNLSFNILNYQLLQVTIIILLALIYFVLKPKNIFWKGLLLGFIIEFLITLGISYFIA